jgi:hypothetical protein
VCDIYCSCVHACTLSPTELVLLCYCLPAAYELEGSQDCGRMQLRSDISQSIRLARSGRLLLDT